MASSRHLNRGVVLLTTLLIVALLAALAWQLVGRHTLLIAQYRQGLGSDQALAYALGAESFARQILHQDWADGGAEKDTLLEPWAQAAPPFDIDHGFIEIRAHDLNGCFNLNSLSDALPPDFGSGSTEPAANDSGDGLDESEQLPEPDAPGDEAPPADTSPPADTEQMNSAAGGQADGDAGVERSNEAILRRLLDLAELPETLAPVWQDWVDSDSDPGNFGAEDTDYLLNEPPYRTANQPAAAISELRLVRGFEPEMLARLEGQVCTVPDPTLKVNINTAPPRVLAALSGTSNLEALSAFTEGPRDFSDKSEFVNQFPEFAAVVDALAVSSEYFEVSIRVRVDDAQVELTSLLHRDPASGRVTLLGRNLGRRFDSQPGAATESLVPLS